MGAGALQIRQAEPEDCGRICGLALASGQVNVDCRAMLAEYDGHLLAALPLSGAAAVVDPLLPTERTVGQLRRALSAHSRQLL